MDNAELLRNGRNLLLKLHKALVDHERRIYEEKNGRVTSGQFLNLLLDDADFAWLRRFSSLIVDIDEMLDAKDDPSDDAITEHINYMRDLVFIEDAEDYYRTKYEAALQDNVELVGIHAELKALLRD